MQSIQQSTTRQPLPLRAAFYIRMSTGKEEQKDSPATQRKECELVRQFNGYSLVDEYVDKAISGNSFEERPGLQRMIADARAGKFDIIIVDKRERLSRLDDEEWAQHMAPWLRETKMKIHSAVEGLADYSSKNFSRSIQDSCTAFAAHQQLESTAANVARGSKAAAENGFHLGGIPDGYDSLPIDRSNPRSHKKLFKNDRAWIPEWLFTAYDSGAYSLQRLCDKLNADGVPSPRLAKHKKHHKPLQWTPVWQVSTVKTILSNIQYTGRSSYGEMARGKHARIINGERHVGDFKDLPAVKNDNPIQRDEAWEPIVSLELFERVQARLAANQGAGQAHTAEHLFTKLVYCGHCGKALHAKGKKGNVYYQCRKRPEGPHPACCFHSISEQTLLHCIRERLKSGVFKQDVVEAHKAQLRQQREERNIDRPERQQRIEKLRKGIEAAAKRYATELDETIATVIRQQLSGMKAELQQLEIADKNDTDALQQLDAAIQETEAAIKAYKILVSIQPTEERNLETFASHVLYEELVESHFFGDKETDQQIGEAYTQLSKSRQLERELSAAEAVVTPQQHRAALLAWVKRITVCWDYGQPTPGPIDSATTIEKHTKRKLDKENCTIEVKQGQKSELFKRVLTKARLSTRASDERVGRKFERLAVCRACVSTLRHGHPPTHP
jgi:DNA invertase Pin-like site-specific DNA recombinase